MFRDIINLLEEKLHHSHVWHGASKEDAERILDSGVHIGKHGFRTSYDPSDIDDDIILEFHVNSDAHILNPHEHKDNAIWRRHRHDDPEDLVHRGIDGVYTAHGITFFNPDVLKFTRVYNGVINDPMEDTDTSELDEYALGGLARCTAVTVNALLSSFKMRPITVAEVPADNLGVLRILTQHGLSYAPDEADVGRTVMQFVNMHPRGAWYISTQQHAMALVNGRLFDAENRGADGRKILAAYQITRR